MTEDSSELFRVAHQAMATEFEILFPANCGVAIDKLDGLAEAVFHELDLLEDELSRYRGNSDISRINRLQPGQVARVGMATFDCLALARAVFDETGGAFDISIGPLMAAYRTKEGTPLYPDKVTLDLARERTGNHVYELHPEDLSITCLGEGMSLDLGGVGKGYALDQMAETLREWGIENALLNAGESTVLAIGCPPGETEGWPVRAEGAPDGEIFLTGFAALSGSGFLQRGAHIMDPRKGKPVKPKARRTWALAPTAAMSDALSTAFSVMKKREIRELNARHDGIIRSFIAEAEG